MRCPDCGNPSPDKTIGEEIREMLEKNLRILDQYLRTKPAVEVARKRQQDEKP